jgi:hypothetical protein
MGHALIRATHLCPVCGPAQEKAHPKYTGKAILMLVAELVEEELRWCLVCTWMKSKLVLDGSQELDENRLDIQLGFIGSYTRVG